MILISWLETIQRWQPVNQTGATIMVESFGVDIVLTAMNLSANLVELLTRKTEILTPVCGGRPIVKRVC